MIDFNPDIFRAYDIRGVAGTDLTESNVEAIGWAVAELITRDRPAKFVVGGDSRQSTPELKKALIKGITGNGGEVIDIGLATSPLVYFCVASWNAAGGVNVTGSHNPPEQNGLKLVGPRAQPLSSQEIQQVYQLARGGFPIRTRRQPGQETEQSPAEEYLEFVFDYIGRKNGRPPAGYKVVVDCANGTAGLFAPELFRRLGCEVIELYCELKSVPERGSDPAVADNLKVLQKKVLASGASLGVAFDGDGDRLGIVGSDGSHIASEFGLVILARDFLRRHPGATVLFDVRCSANVSRDILKHGGNPYMYKTGHSLIKREMDRKGILLGGEGTGHIFFGEDYWGVDDGLIAAAAITAIVSNSGKPVETHLDDLPEMALSPDFRIEVAEARKRDVSTKVGEELRAKYPSVDVDGIRADFGDGWALVRPSNTEANIVVRAEAETPERLRQILVEVEDIFSRYLPAGALAKIHEFRTE